MKFTVKIQSLVPFQNKLRGSSLRAFRDAQPHIAALITQRVIAEADKANKGSADLYRKALAQPDAITFSENKIEIRLSSKMLVAVENGATSFDMKRIMLQKAKKFTKDGSPYIDIPFQHAAQKGQNAPGLPKDVYSAIKAATKKSVATLVNNGVPKDVAKLAPVRLRTTTPGKVFERTLNIGGQQFKTVVEHKRGIYDDLLRTAVQGSKKVITKYQTFRRISANSAATSWWHPGFKGAHLFDRILNRLRPDISAILHDSYKIVKGKNT